MNSYKIGAYLRISAGDQDIGQSGKSESDSIANQRNLIEDFISRIPEFADADIIEFCDDGWSGKNFERPAVKKMLEGVRSGGINCIIVKDLSRFGRDYLTVGNYLSRVFPFLGVRFIAVNDGFDSIRDADIDSLDTAFKTFLYDFYSRDLSYKVRSAKQFKAQRGEFISPFAPYGYKKAKDSKNKLVIDVEAAKVVRWIYQMAIKGRRSEEIAKILNEEQVLTPMLYKRAMGCSRLEWQCVSKDNFWTDGTVVKILRDERYTGKNIYGKRTRDEVGKSHVVRVERTGWIVTDNAHEGIVSQEEFERAQEQLREYSERNSVLPGRKGTTLYKKVRCGVCGHIMKRVNTKQPYYICSTPRVTDAYSCMSEKILESDLLETVLTGLRMQALYAVDISRIWEEKRNQRKSDVNGILKILTDLKESRTGLENSIQALYEKFAFGELDKEGYLSAKRIAVEKRDVITSKIEEFEAKLKSINAKSALENKFADHFSQYAEIEELTAEIVADVLEGIIVYPEYELNVAWNYQEDLKQLLLDVRAEEK